jgi:hypothetical protein
MAIESVGMHISAKKKPLDFPSRWTTRLQHNNYASREQSSIDRSIHLFPFSPFLKEQSLIDRRILLLVLSHCFPLLPVFSIL